MLTIIKIAAVFVAVSFVVFWVGLVWWVAQDVLTRTKDKIIVSAAVAITAILGPVGILIYLVVRPRQTLKERLGEMMEQEMMLQASAITICPTCDHMAQEDFLACPYCGTTLKKACQNCGKLLAMDWDHCPFCNTRQSAPVVVEEITVVDADGHAAQVDIVAEPTQSLLQRLSPIAASWKKIISTTATTPDSSQPQPDQDATVETKATGNSKKASSSKKSKSGGKKTTGRKKKDSSGSAKR